MSQQPSSGNESSPPQAQRLAALVEAALDLASAHELEEVLTHMVERAADVAGARYAALGIYGDNGIISRFIHHGVDEETVVAIGALPEGRGLLGEVIAADGPTRVDDISHDPRSVGFPAHHPEMRSFLGVPVRSGARRYGSLYVTNRLRGDSFDESDETLLVALAAFSACAIDNAMLVQAEHDRAAALERLDTAEEMAKLRQDLIEQIIGAQEAERARVARDLHDQIGQSLTSILIALRVFENAGPDSDEGRRRGEELRELVTDTLDDVRQLAFELRPAVLDDIGLRTALQRLGDSLHQRLGLKVSWQMMGLDDDNRLESNLETTVYRIAQEALTNVARHAGVDAVSATITSTPTTLTVEITDTGTGFDPQSVRSSLGVAGMHERAALAGGRLTIASELGRGTSVRLEVAR